MLSRLWYATEWLTAQRYQVYIVAEIFVLIFIGAFILEHGNWTRTQEFRGPFERNPTGTSEYRVAIGTDIPFLSIPSSWPETNEGSLVRLWVNGENWRPPEPLKPSVDQGKLLGIRGLYRTLQFALPANVANTASTVLRVEYPVKIHRTSYNTIVFSAKALVLLAICLGYRSGECAWIRMIVGWAVSLIWVLGVRTAQLMHLTSRALIVACILYAGTIAYGSTKGDALPTATVFHLIPWARLVTDIVPFAPLGLVVFAAVGAALTWLAWFELIPPVRSRELEFAQMRLWQIFGLPVLLCLFLFTLSAGGWSGYVHTTDLNYMSLAGLVPHSDSAGYYKDTFHLAYFGDWELMGTRRPMAEAFREITTVAANYSFPGTLVMQLALMAVMLYFASWLLARWYGIWVGIGFAGLAFNVARPFLSTTLTEPLGYIWGLISLIYFIQSIRQRSLPHALLGLAALTVALLMRMGALFAIPFIVLWIGCAFGKSLAARVRLIGLACMAVVAVLAVNFALERFYGAEGVGTGDNFAWTMCGLSVGMSWNGCGKVYEATLSSLPDERAQSVFLLAMTWQNFVHDPSVLLGQVWDNFSAFVSGIGPFMFSGYLPSISLDSFAKGASYLLLLPLMALFYVVRRTSVTERWFWFAMLASIPPSAGVVMLADGWRLLHVTHLFVASFLALGFAPPQVANGTNPAPSLRWQQGAAALGASLLVFVAFPALAHAMAQWELQAHPPIHPPGAHEEIVTGGKRMSGFLVIPDLESYPRTVPALHVSEFARLISESQIESDFGPFLKQVLPRVPFAFVSAGRMDGSNITNIYIAPPDILLRKDVWAWRFTTRSWLPGEMPWSILQDVVAAEPLP